MYKLRYGRTWNLGNYESERIELEIDYDDAMPEAEALADIKNRLESMRSRNPKASVPR